MPNEVFIYRVINNAANKKFSQFHKLYGQNAKHTESELFIIFQNNFFSVQQLATEWEIVSEEQLNYRNSVS